MWDVVIRGGTVVDGTGADSAVADVAIEGGKIAAVGHLTGPARRTIDAAGKTVTPGFIDVHRHGDLAVFRPGFGEIELRQGLTTIVNGNCGMSAAPFGPAHRSEILQYLAPVLGPGTAAWATMADYLADMEKVPLPLHVGTLAGGGVIRSDVSGLADVPLTDSDLRAIHRAVGSALADGALGVSLGLGYAPECYYSPAELARALAPLAGGDRPVTAHIRDEGSGVENSVAEMIELARTLRCPVHISHLKAIGKVNWNRRIPRVLEMLAKARDEGLDVTWDVYPYTAGSTQLLHVLPPEVLSGGAAAACRRLSDPVWRARIKERLVTARDYNNIVDLVGWDNIYLTTMTRPENQAYIGLSVTEAAARQGKTPTDCAFGLLISEQGNIAMVDFINGAQDIAAILQSEAVSVISDSTYPTAGKPHPRLYGTFVRVIEKYVLQDHVLTLPQAVHRMTAAPAAALGLKSKGQLRPGFDADICIFAPAALHETAAYTDSARFPTGMDTVLVSGVAALENGKLTGRCAGAVIRR